jgi:hypothetical protein
METLWIVLHNPLAEKMYSFTQFTHLLHTDPIPVTRRIQEMYPSFDRDFLPVLSQIYEIMLVLWTFVSVEQFSTTHRWVATLKASLH